MTKHFWMEAKGVIVKNEKDNQSQIHTLYGSASRSHRFKHAVFSW